MKILKNNPGDLKQPLAFDDDESDGGVNLTAFYVTGSKKKG